MIEWLINIVGRGPGYPGWSVRHRWRSDRHTGLGVLFGLDQQLAQGTALVMVVPNVLLALWRYHQRNRIELRHALPLAACSFCSLGLGRSGRWASTPIPCAWASWAFWWRWRCGMWRGCSYRSPCRAPSCATLAVAGRAGQFRRCHGRVVRGRRGSGGHADPDQRIRRHTSCGARVVPGLGRAQHTGDTGHLRRAREC